MVRKFIQTASKALCLLVFLTLSVHGRAENIRSITTADGLSNSSILSLYQNNYGYVFVGTCDGLNIWDGRTFLHITAAGKYGKGISGNLIEEIHGLEDNKTWVKTNYGLDLMQARNVLENHTQFTGIYNLISASLKKSVVLTKDNTLYGYNAQSRQFTPVRSGLGECCYTNFLSAWTNETSDNILIASKDGLYEAQFTASADGTASLTDPVCIIRKSLIFASKQYGDGFIIDSDNMLYSYSQDNKKLFWLTDLSQLIAQRGNVSEIIKYGEDILISFLYSGMVCLHYNPQDSNMYTVEPWNVDCGIFTLFQDKFQDITWIGTDGKGLMMFVKSPVDFHNFYNKDLPRPVTSPVRALMLDRDGNLLMATKGEGIVKFPAFDPKAVKSGSLSRHIGRSDGLSNSTVYALEQSRRGHIWIGTEGSGIEYMDPVSCRVQSVGGNVPEDLRWIHAIYEQDDSTLWVSTVGCGIFRLNLRYIGSTPVIESYSKPEITFKGHNNNFFFCLYPDKDGNFWFGNRGGGLVRYDSASDKATVLSPGNDLNNLANDVWAITRDASGRLWLGTSYGLISMEINGHFKPTEIRQTVHSILEDASGALWVSTNNGLFHYDPEHNTYTRFDRSYGLGCTEFCDGAMFRDSATDNLYFGNTEGFVVLEHTGNTTKEFYPKLQFRSARISGESVLFSTIERNGEVVIPAGETLNSISVNVLDHINGSNIVYSYRMNEEQQWIDTPSELQFASLSYGSYTLHVRYTNTSTGFVSEESTLRIVLKAPWYLSTWFKIVLILLGGAVVTYIYVSVRGRRHRRRQQQIERVTAKMKEESLGTRLNMMSTFSQEMTSPVTLISALIQQIEHSSDSGPEVRDYSVRLRHQIEKLSKILSIFQYYSESSELKESTSNKIFSISDLASVMADSFRRPCAKRDVELQVSVPQELMWTGDQRRIATIMDSLLTNALIHSPAEGRIHLDIRVKDNNLEISVSNVEKWISRSTVERIFDRFYAIDHFSMRSENGDSYQDEMRLAICHNITQSIGGSIRFIDNVDSICFRVSVPGTAPESENAEQAPLQNEVQMAYNPMVTHALVVDESLTKYSFGQNKRLMYLLGKDTAILNLIADIFSEEFNVATFNYIGDFRSNVRSLVPDIIICENLYSNQDITDAVAAIKKDKKTVRTPVIMLSSSQQLDSQEQDNPADISIPVPFNVKFLKSAVKQSLNRVEDLKDYYSSSISTYEFCEGQMLHRDDKLFVDKVFEVIQQNVSDSTFGAEQLAQKLNMSLSKLYNKLRECIKTTPSALLREYRLKYAEKLLLTSKMSIDEIIYKSGFMNRGTFYKSFLSHAGCTPKQFRQQHNMTTDFE